MQMSSSHIIKNADAIISIDARGFIFGSAISLQASKPMIVARKPGKLPGEIIEKSYSLEYGQNSLSIQDDSIKDLIDKKNKKDKTDSNKDSNIINKDKDENIQATQKAKKLANQISVL